MALGYVLTDVIKHQRASEQGISFVVWKGLSYALSTSGTLLAVYCIVLYVF
jgi:hypothetical protein